VNAKQDGCSGVGVGSLWGRESFFYFSCAFDIGGLDLGAVFLRDLHTCPGTFVVLIYEFTSVSSHVAKTDTRWLSASIK
jgi:hypothetical protein